MTKLTEQDYKDLRTGKKTEDEVRDDQKATAKAALKDNISIKQFLLNRTHETVNVPIEGDNGTMDIEIRAHFSKSELKNHKEFMDLWSLALTDDPEILESDKAEQLTAEFLSDLCIDPDLDKSFWLSDDLDPFISQSVLIAYFTNAINRVEDIRKFRKK